MIKIWEWNWPVTWLVSQKKFGNFPLWRGSFWKPPFRTFDLFKLISYWYYLWWYFFILIFIKFNQYINTVSNCTVSKIIYFCACLRLEMTLILLNVITIGSQKDNNITWYYEDGRYRNQVKAWLTKKLTKKSQTWHWHSGWF